MMYTTRPITAYWLSRLWANLWDRGIEEFRKLGMSKEEGFCAFLFYAQQALESTLVCVDGEPVMVIGAMPDGDGYCTFMQCTKDFDEHAYELMSFINEYSELIPDPLYIYSVMVHPDTEKFFRVLGFKKDGWVGRTKVGVPLHRFRRSKPCAAVVAEARQ